MKENILIILAILILAAILGQSCCKNYNRYEVVSGNNMLTILVDKQTGETWRNCICGKDSNVPGCWEKMFTINPESFNKPVGEAKAVDKMIKIQKQVLKEQEKQAKKQQVQQPIQQEQK
jgi:hypothetical protein